MEYSEHAPEWPAFFYSKKIRTLIIYLGKKDLVIKETLLTENKHCMSLLHAPQTGSNVLDEH